jgi:hypothetical protein
MFLAQDDSSPVVFSQTVQLGGRLYLAEWIIWPPAQFFNFYFLPTRLKKMLACTYFQELYLAAKLNYIDI